MTTPELDFTKPELLQTRGGYEFRIHATDIGGQYPVLATVRTSDGWEVLTLSRFGREFSKGDSPNDLIPKPPAVTGWANMYGDGLSSGGKIYQTQANARKAAGPGCIGQIYIDAEVQQ